MGTFALCISAIPLLLLFYWNVQVFPLYFENILRFWTFICSFFACHRVANLLLNALCVWIWSDFHKSQMHEAREEENKEFGHVLHYSDVKHESNIKDLTPKHGINCFKLNLRSVPVGQAQPWTQSRGVECPERMIIMQLHRPTWNEWLNFCVIDFSPK